MLETQYYYIGHPQANVSRMPGYLQESILCTCTVYKSFPISELEVNHQIKDTHAHELLPVNNNKENRN